MIVITKITNKEQRYTMVDVFSSFEKAEEFTEAFCNKFIPEGDFNQKWEIVTEKKELDSPDYPFLKTV